MQGEKRVLIHFPDLLIWGLEVSGDQKITIVGYVIVGILVFERLDMGIDISGLSGIVNRK